MKITAKSILIFLLNLALFFLTFYAGYLYLQTDNLWYIGAAVANFVALKAGLMVIGIMYNNKKKQPEEEGVKASPEMGGTV